MLQRSTHPGAVDVPDIPATIQPGETIDWPSPIAGFEPVADAPQPDKAPPKSSTRKKAAPESAPIGEEPQS